MSTIDRRLRDLEERIRPGPDTRRPVNVAFVLELYKQPIDDMHLVLEASDRFESDRAGRPRTRSFWGTASELTDEDLAARCSPILARIEVELSKIYTSEEMKELGED
jgi:hypothetical protein